MRFLINEVMSVTRFGKVLAFISSNIISVHLFSFLSGFPMTHTLDLLTMSHISFLLISGFSVVFLCSSCFMYIGLCFDSSSNLVICFCCVHSAVNPFTELLVSNTIFYFYRINLILFYRSQFCIEISILLCLFCLVFYFIYYSVFCSPCLPTLGLFLLTILSVIECFCSCHIG